MYRDLESWEQALIYANKAADGFKSIENWPRLSQSMTMIAIIYGKQNLWNQAIDYYLNALQIDTEHDNFTAQALTFHNLGEAYFKAQQIELALEFLLKAHHTFSEKNNTLYLISNNLLIADVASNKQDWQTVNHYASQALILAQELKLNDQILEALRYQAKALKELGQIESSLMVIEQLLSYSQKPVEKEIPKQAFSLLAEQQLKIQLAQAQSQQQTHLLKLEQHRFQFICSLFIAFITGLICYHQWRSKRKLQQQHAKLQQKFTQEPISGFTGYNGFHQLLSHNQLNQTQRSTQLAMVSLTNKHNSDMELGLEVSHKLNQQLLEALSQSLTKEVFFIRPGVILLAIETTDKHEAILQKLRTVIDQNPWFKDASLQLGIIDLPLMDNPNIKLSASTYFNVLQMLTAAAATLGKESDHFVSITPLNFAPTTIFSAPLYPQLEQAIKRGLVKVSSNGNKEQIIWSHWRAEDKSAG